MLVRLLEACGAPDRFHVVSLADEGCYGERLRASGVAVTSLKIRSALSSLLALIRLITLLRRLRPDVAQTWMYHADLLGGVAARVARVSRLVWGLRQSAPPDWTVNRVTSVIAWLCARLSSWLPDQIVSCSYRAAEAHSAFGYDPQRMTVLPNGFDLEKYRPDPQARFAIRGELGLANDSRVFGTVARVHPMKDHHNLLTAFGIVRKSQPDCRLVLCGTNAEAENVELLKLVRMLNLGESVLLLGQRQDVWRIMNGIDIHVLSSAHSEGFPNVIGEAMASGTPCVATDVGDCREVLGDTGWLVPPRDSAALARAMIEAISEPAAQRASRAVRCRQRISAQFEIGAVSRRFEALWQELAAAGRGG
jgi:glycosyltransferase involved in cell wall biosynthesis